MTIGKEPPIGTGSIQHESAYAIFEPRGDDQENTYYELGRILERAKTASTKVAAHVQQFVDGVIRYGCNSPTFDRHLSRLKHNLLDIKSGDSTLRVADGCFDGWQAKELKELELLVFVEEIE